MTIIELLLTAVVVALSVRRFRRARRRWRSRRNIGPFPTRGDVQRGAAHFERRTHADVMRAFSMSRER